MSALRRLPLFLLLFGVVSVSAVVPAVHALVLEDHADARAFFYAGLMGVILTVMIAIAISNRPWRRDPLRRLVALLASFAVLPLFIAIPFHEAVGNTSLLSAYMEMVSSFTTTGATLYPPERLTGPEHLWRAQIGWIGGLVMWVAASAIMAPLTLGGFEVTASGEPGQSTGEGAATDGMRRWVDPLWRAIDALVPVYGGLTLVLAVLMLVAGEEPLLAVTHAMGVMATSGISPVGSLDASAAGPGGEVILFCFLLFGLSRMTFSGDTARDRGRGLRDDPEFRLGLFIIAVVPLVLFLRHWVAAFDIGDEDNLLAAIQALWGGLFTALSFLVTAGYVSADWGAAQDWSGLSTPGLILMGLALVGGGVATTAGGVKLLRVYALYANGAREIQRLVHPSSVGRTGLLSRRIRREGGFIAWVFFMLFALVLAGFTVLLGLAGLSLEHATVLTIAVLSNTGPLIAVAPAESIDLLALSPAVKGLLCLGMVLGRMELLALIVMFSPDLWRD